MAVLSIHSHVAAGHVGNAAAVFTLQRLGVEVWPVHTVELSHHPGHGSWRGHRVAPAHVEEILSGLETRGLFTDCAAVLTGYLGSAAMGAVAVDAWRRILTASPQALICCDPIIGDDAEGQYVDDDLVAFYRRDALPAAHVLFPNRFELEVLSATPVSDTTSAIAAARALLIGRPEMILISSIPGNGGLGTVLVTAGGAWGAAAPKVPLRAKGAGDFFAALWIGHFVQTGDPVAALQTAVSALQVTIEAASEMDAAELPIIATQDAWLAPPNLIDVETLDQ